MEREDSGSFSGAEDEELFLWASRTQSHGMPYPHRPGATPPRRERPRGSWSCAHTQASCLLCFPPFPESAPCPAPARGLWLVRRRGAFRRPSSSFSGLGGSREKNHEKESSKKTKTQRAGRRRGSLLQRRSGRATPSGLVPRPDFELPEDLGRPPAPKLWLSGVPLAPSSRRAGSCSRESLHGKVSGKARLRTNM